MVRGHRFQRGFTLVELLVVITIIAILIAMLLPAVQAAREAVRRLSCQDHMREVALAMHNVHSATGALPVGAYGCCYGSWQVAILSYIEQGTLRDQYLDYGKTSGMSYYSSANIAAATGKQLPVLLCPSDNVNRVGWPGGAASVSYHNYVVNFGNTAIDESTAWQAATYNGLKFAGAPFTHATAQALESITDGTSNTLLVSEVVQGMRHDLRGCTWWGTGSGFVTSLRPNDSSPDLSWSNSSWCDSDGPNPPCALRTSAYVFGARSRHPGGINTMMCDGSGRFVSNSITPAIWQSLSTTHGGETIGDY